MFDASLPELGDLAWPASSAASQPGADLALPVTPPHGLIAIYTLLDDKVAAFDRAADEVAEQVRASEPDTLVYVIHTVPKAPMQRIFYEVYRDRAAYEKHEQQPYVQRFVTARRPYVLATNVIELRLKFAKVSPLPQAEAQAAQAQAAQAQAQGQAQRPAGAPNLPAVRNGNGGRPADSRPTRPRHGGGRPDTPDYPSREPGYPAREPAYQPRQPSYQPRDPGYEPRDPGYQRRDPGYEPRDPGYQPRDPGYEPRDPGYQPRDPGYPPRQPQFIPRDQDYPVYPPRDQGYPPRDQEYLPPDPGYPPAGRAPERAREPRDWSGEPRDWPREPRDPYAEPRDPYDPPAESWYDRI
jgi:quinol monooxygenase YgiN